MTDADHAELVGLERTGRLLVGVDRAVARKLFTEVSVATIARATGYAPYLEEATVFLLFVLGPVSLAGSIAISFLGFGW